MRIFVLTGAGISVESGIPAFRGKDGLWVRAGQAGFDPAKLATPEAFARDPKLVWEWYSERRNWIRAAEPNAAHNTIAELARHAEEFLLVTQNVDDLHARAGLPNEKMVQIHGDIFETRCSHCDFSIHTRESKLDGLNPSSPSISPGKLDGFNPSSSGTPRKTDESFKTPSLSGGGSAKSDLPRCRECGALMRPGVVWFGEQLDPNKIDLVEDFLGRGPVDLTIVIGTTALFGYIVDWAVRARGPNGRLIEINPEETPLSRYATKTIRKPAAVALKTSADFGSLLAGGVLNQHPENKSD